MTEAEQEAFNQGLQAAQEHEGDITKAQNPYKKTNPHKWYLWNRGWNSYVFRKEESDE